MPQNVIGSPACEAHIGPLSSSPHNISTATPEFETSFVEAALRDYGWWLTGKAMSVREHASFLHRGTGQVLISSQEYPHASPLDPRY